MFEFSLCSKKVGKHCFDSLKRTFSALNFEKVMNHAKENKKQFHDFESVLKILKINSQQNLVLVAALEHPLFHSVGGGWGKVVNSENYRIYNDNNTFLSVKQRK